MKTIRPVVRLHPDRQRSVEQVDASLRQMFADLIAGRKPWPLLLYGEPGVGKTCAALCLCDTAATAALLTVDALCGQIMHGDERELWPWLAAKELAVVDELGARQTIGDLHYSALKGFCDARDGKPTVYIANGAPQSLRTLYDDRIFSRIACGSWFELRGADRRFAR